MDVVVKKTLLTVISLGFVAAIAFAKEETKTGFVIPSQCQPKTEGVPQPEGSRNAWPAPHTTACALEDACIKSGYGLWVQDRFFRFDERGQEIALAYFETTPRTSYNKVAVTGDFSGDVVKVRFLRMVD